MLQQRHSILLWKGIEDWSFNEYSREAYYIYEALKRYSHICEWNMKLHFEKKK